MDELQKLNDAQKVLDETKENPEVRKVLEANAVDAAHIIGELMVISRNENIKLAAARDILDRSGYKPVERNLNAVQLNATNLQINAMPSPEEFDKLLESYVRRKPTTVIDSERDI